MRLPNWMTRLVHKPELPKVASEPAPPVNPRSLLPLDHPDYIKPENITETTHRLRVPPPGKL